ncbi:hypothetical protein C7999DRAFT_36101, partial [Corynascus novoguineensis]
AEDGTDGDGDVVSPFSGLGGPAWEWLHDHGAGLISPVSGLLPTWSHRERYNEAKGLVSECIGADAIIDALGSHARRPETADPAADADAVALDHRDWALYVNIGYRGINQTCVEASDASLLRRAFNSACDLGLYRAGAFGDWILPCRSPRAAAFRSICNLLKIAEHSVAVAWLGFEWIVPPLSRGDSTPKDPTSTNREELQRQRSSIPRYDSDAGEKVGDATAAWQPVKVISILLDSDSDGDPSYRSSAASTAGGNGHDAFPPMS